MKTTFMTASLLLVATSPLLAHPGHGAPEHHWHPSAIVFAAAALTLLGLLFLRRSMGFRANSGEASSSSEKTVLSRARPNNS